MRWRGTRTGELCAVAGSRVWPPAGSEDKWGASEGSGWRDPDRSWGEGRGLLEGG